MRFMYVGMSRTHLTSLALFNRRAVPEPGNVRFRRGFNLGFEENDGPAALLLDHGLLVERWCYAFDLSAPTS